MKSYILIASLLLSSVFAVSTAQAANTCGPTICTVQPFCGNPGLNAAQQHCLFPVWARYCEVRMCARNSWWMAWTWYTL